MPKSKKVQSELQRAKKRSRAAKKGWKTRRKNQKERSEIERLTRENKALLDALEAEKKKRQKLENADPLRQAVLKEIAQREMDEINLGELISFALEEGIMRPEEIKAIPLIERLKSLPKEEMIESVQLIVQRRMDRARRIFGDTLLEAYLLVDEFEELGFEDIHSIYDLWDSDPGMAA